MSQGLCPSCGAAVNLTAGQTETKCQYCDTTVTVQQAEAQFEEVKTSRVGGTLLIAQTAQEGGSYSEALNYYNKVIEQQPDFAEAWLNKGICMVRTSKIGDLRIPEAISSWKAAIKFTKHPEAMKKRVATEINNVVSEFYPVLENHYREFSSLGNAYEEHARRFLLLESGLALALEFYPTKTIAKNGIYLCERFIESVKTSNMGGDDWGNMRERVAAELTVKLKALKDKYEQVLAKIDPNWNLPASVVELIRKGNSYKIAAIKELRSIRPDLGLAEAKKLVEEAGVKLGTMTVAKGGCFVATACYGDYDHPAVMELRHFRDECLETSTAGRAFVRWYYQWSPAFANFVAKSGILKALTRILIVSPALAAARFIELNRKLNTKY